MGIFTFQTEEAVWDKIFEINVKCAWLLAKEAYPELVKRGGGNIVFISSIAAYQPMEVTTAFCNLADRILYCCIDRIL